MLAAKVKPTSHHFITFGTGDWVTKANCLAKQAEASHVFATTRVYAGLESLTTAFREKYAPVLTSKRGGGYWLWKLDIIQQALSSLEPGDVLVYLDSGPVPPLGSDLSYYDSAAL